MEGAIGEVNRMETMKITPAMRNGAFITAVLCVGIGYALAGNWLIAPASPVALMVWAVMRKRSSFVSSSALLLGLVVLTAMGVLMDLPVYLMLIASTMALVGWDLEHYIWRGAEGLPQQNATHSFDWHHLRQLALAVSTGLIFASLGTLISLKLPFWGVVLLALAAVQALVIGVRVIMTRAS